MVVTTTKRAALRLALIAFVALGGPACSSDKNTSGEPEGAAGAGAGSSAGQAGDGSSAGAGAGNGSGAGGPGGAAANEPAAPGVPPTFTPKFPGAGTSGDDAPLTNGELCDYVPAGGAPTPNEITKCFFGGDDPVPAATLEQVLECVDGTDVVHIRLTFNPNFVDNTYGANAIGWGGSTEPMMEPVDPMMPGMGMRPRPPRGGGGGHTFLQLVRSDHAEVVMKDEAGNTVLQFKMDYITADDSAESGYGTLCVGGGDGKMIVGDPEWILGCSTSLAKNLNERGYGSYTVDSPATDASYTPNPDTPEWDYRMVYEAWVDVEAFGDSGFGGALIEFVHASPAKSEDDTIEVTPGDCPPELCTDPDGCYDGPPPPTDCDPTAPDENCGEGDPPPPPDDEDEDPPAVCLETPDDPACRVD